MTAVAMGSYIGFVLLLITAALYDLATLSIPNALSLLLVILFFVACGPNYEKIAFLDHLVGAGLVFAICTVLFYFGIFGGGDAKLLSATALWTGFGLLMDQVFYLAVFGLMLVFLLLLFRMLALWPRIQTHVQRHGGLPRALRRDEGVPYGVAISASALAVSFQFPPFLNPFQ